MFPSSGKKPKKNLQEKSKRASKRGSFGRPIFEGCLEREHHFWEPVLAMNGKRVARKGMRIQAKEIVRKQKREARKKAK